MLLAIEQGNTNTVFAVHDGESWIAQWRTATESSRTADEYAVWLSQFLQMQGMALKVLDACVISTVVPQSLFNLRNLSRRYLKTEPLVIGENARLGIELRIDNPAEAGADRLVNCIGAYLKYGGPLIVVDSGTATNFDIVGADGAFEGGVIAPGVNLSIEALHRAAARLPRVAIQKPRKVIGTDNRGQYAVGHLLGLRQPDRGACGPDQAEYGRPMKVVGTRRPGFAVPGGHRFHRPTSIPTSPFGVCSRSGGATHRI